MTSFSEDLPNDLMTKILSLLPFESILRFKAVSKSLNQLLSSHSFARTHSLSSSPSYPNLSLCSCGRMILL
ncbi:hypothetical protein AMTRI_Chr07g75420 [Amborella trichopoda]